MVAGLLWLAWSQRGPECPSAHAEDFQIEVPCAAAAMVRGASVRLAFTLQDTVPVSPMVFIVSVRCGSEPE
ncbi:hypothetical protein B0675_39265 [Streptomyces sp. M41(2017)]|nr:hypothetical protein B0675_39265 [Streptomyces sp. M41(2017)]